MVSSAVGRPVAVLLLLAGVVGCSRQGRSPREGTPTFNGQIGRVLFDRCAPCHRPGQGAPFSLLTYADAQSRATKISRAVQTGHMPPWLPAQGGPAFIGERRLTSDEVDAIRRWAESNAPEGPADQRPTPPVFPADWELGAPDLVLTPKAPYELPAGTGDAFRNLVIQVPLTADRYVRAVEFKTAGAPVHHAVVHIDRTPESRRRDGQDGQPGFDGMGGRDVQDPDGHFLGWAPGRGPIVAPEGLPWVLRPGTDLVLELHLTPGSAPARVQPSIALYFSDTPPARAPVFLKLGSKTIDIPAGARNYTVTDTLTLPVDADVLSLYPHAHYLGKTMDVHATLPDGTDRMLLDIRRWSFRWQQDYRFVTPVTLPRGTTLSMRFTYDNSADNPDNPNRPPKQVMCGQNSTDEMGNLGVQVVTRSAADRQRLLNAALEHEARANLAGAEMLVRYNPANAENQRFLGGTYMDVGRTADALPHLLNAVRLDPQSASAQNELAGALLKTGQVAEAVSRWREAVRLAPYDARFVFNLGKGLAAAGQPDEAQRTFERALAINPGLAEAHDELGVLLFARRQLPQALTHLQRAVDLAPDSPIFLSDLGGALAQAGRHREALERLQQALAIDPDYSPARDNLTRLRRLPGLKP